MIVRVTVRGAEGASEQDVELVAEPNSSVRSLLAALPGQVAGRPVFIGAHRLDPDTTLADSPLLAGATLSVGGPGPEPSFAARAEVGVLRGGSGSDAGLEVALAPGTHLVGRSATAALCLRDERVSRSQARLEVSAAGQLSVVDLNSANGTQVDDQRITGRAWVRPGGTVRFGDDAVVWSPGLHTVRCPDARLEFDRAFAATPAVQGVSLDLPTRQSAPPRGLVMLLMPIISVVFSVVMVLVTKQVDMLAFSALGVVSSGSMYAVQAYEQRKHRFDYAQRQRATVASIAAYQESESQLRQQLAPGPEEIVEAALGARPNLWPRGADSPLGLTLRVGTTDQPAAIELRGERWPGLQQPMLHDVPLTVDLRATGVLGLVGAEQHTQPLLRWLLIQLATLRSPGDLRLVLITASDDAELAWLRWLPHLEVGAAAEIPCWIGNTPATRQARVAELQTLITTRLAARANAATPVGIVEDVVVVLHGASALRNLPGMRQVLRDGPAAGVYVLCVDQRGVNECRGLCEVDGQYLLLTRGRDEQPVAGRPESVSAPVAERLARSVAPLRDRLAVADQNSIPYPVRFLDLLDIGTPTADDIDALWRRHPGPTTSIPLGRDARGTVNVDLALHGPHTMLGGATGAGKSILLQTLVTSLLLANRPDELNLVLVDFKGGSAFLPFQHCPHVVALIRSTGETAADVFDDAAAGRVLASVRAEVRRRESMLARYGGEIDEYWRARRGDPTLPPLPRLVMIFDEFARVLETVPDFLKELVNVAAKGRSLGMHLVLATQSLQGKLSAELKNNIELRISLRQNEPADSSEVLGVPDAASIPGTLRGRGMILCTKDETRTPRPFQSGYLGAPPPAGGTVPVSVRALRWHDLGEQRPPVVLPDSGLPADQELVIAAIEDAARRAGLRAPHRPLLPPLADDVPLDQLPDDAHMPAGTGADDGTSAPARIPFAIADEPDAQAQPAVALDLSGTDRLLIAGGPQSGRTTAVRALITSLAKRFRPDQAHVYVIERQPSGLSAYADLPHCGGVFGADEPDRVRRLVEWLNAEVERRRAGRPDDRSPRPQLVVLVDGWEYFENRGDQSFTETSLVTTMHGIISMGPPLGVHVVPVCGADLPGKLSRHFNRRLLLPFPKEETRKSLMEARSASAPQLPGRALDAGDGRQVQICRPTETPVDLVAAARAAWPADSYAPGAVKRFPALPACVRLGELVGGPAPSARWIPLGVGGQDTSTLGLDLFDTGPHLLLVSGPPGSGRSTAAAVVAHALRRLGVGVLAVASPRSGLRRLLPDDEGVRVLIGSTHKDADLREAAAAFGDGGYVLLLDDADQLTVTPSQQGFSDQPTLLDEISQPSELGRRGLVVAGDGAPIVSGKRRSLYKAVGEIMSSGARLFLTPGNRAAARDMSLTLEADQYFTAPPGRGYLVVGASTTLLQVALVD